MCLTGDDLGEDLGEVLGEDLGDSLTPAVVTPDTALLAVCRGSGDPGRRRWEEPSGGGPGPTGERTSFALDGLLYGPDWDPAEDGCFATKGPFLVTPSPLDFLSRSLKVEVSILLLESPVLPPSPLLTEAGDLPLWYTTSLLTALLL